MEYESSRSTGASQLVPSTSKFSFERMLVLSTAHIRESSAQKLEAIITRKAGCVSAGPIVYNLSDRAFLLPVLKAPQFLDGCGTTPGTAPLVALNDSYLPCDVRHLIDIARREQADWLLLDCDASLNDELPSWDW